MRTPKPYKRLGHWYLVRRVPKAYRHLDDRSFVYVTTGIRIVDDPRGIRAAQVVADLNNALEQSWRDLEAGAKPNAVRSYEQVRRNASQLGLSYKGAPDLAGSQLAEILHRVAVLEQSNKNTDHKAVEAALGGVAAPELMLSGLLDAFKEEQGASVMDMSPGQLRRWEGNKKRALETFIGVVGDKPLHRLDREDALALRKHWQARVVAGNILITSANKEIGHITRMLRVVEKARRIGIPLNDFTDLRIEGGRERSRPAFETDFIQSVILAEGALAELNEEARRVIYVCADSGLRPVEVVNLRAEHIHLKAAVPYVSIRPEGRRLKTDPSERDIPLVGCALAAMKLQPQGFPRYYDKSDTLSASVNKFLGNHKMLPTERHSLYSLRHAFEDRLTALDAPEKIIAILMGHKRTREKYGNGPSLEHLQRWLNRIAFKPPLAL